MKVILATLTFIAGTMPAAAQWLDRPWAGIPRTADGQPNMTAPAPRGPDGKPDVTGIWNGPNPEARLDPATAARSKPTRAKLDGILRGALGGRCA